MFESIKFKFGVLTGQYEAIPGPAGRAAGGQQLYRDRRDVDISRRKTETASNSSDKAKKWFTLPKFLKKSNSMPIYNGDVSQAIIPSLPPRPGTAGRASMSTTNVATTLDNTPPASPPRRLSLDGQRSANGQAVHRYILQVVDEMPTPSTSTKASSAASPSSSANVSRQPSQLFQGTIGRSQTLPTSSTNQTDIEVFANINRYERSPLLYESQHP